MESDQPYKPLIFWSWNNQLRISELLRQLEAFSKAGFGGCFLHARAGLKTPYLSPEWMDCCRAVCERAQSLGLDIYLYDEDGWPSGFAGGLVPSANAEFCQQAVRFTTTLHSDSCVLAAYVKQDEDYQLIWQSDQIAGTCDNALWPKADLYAVVAVNRAYTDLTNPDAVAYFISVTHDVYAKALGCYFGQVIRGIFTDEPQLAVNGYHWGRFVQEKYRQKLGHSLTEDLWRLEYDGSDVERSQTVRHDYYLLLQQLFAQNYAQQLGAWCEAHHIALTGHFAGEDGQMMQVGPNGGVMPQYVHFQIPGIDHLGKRLAPLPLLKQVQSVARQTGKRQVLSETFGCSGWNLSFDEMTRIWGWQAINGLNLPCLHLSAYSLAGSRKRDYPPAFSEQTPWWPVADQMTGWLTGVNRFFGSCERSCQLLVLDPLHDVWRQYHATGSAEGRHISAEFRSLIENLRNIGMDFDLGDETLLASMGSVQNGTLQIGLGHYQMVLVSEMSHLEPDTIRLLKQLTSQGGAVAFLRHRPRDTEEIPGEILENHPAILQKYLLHSGWYDPVRLYTSKGHPVRGVNLWIGQTEDGRHRIALYPPAEDFGQQDVYLHLPADWSLHLVNPLTKQTTQMESLHDASKAIVKLRLSGQQLVLLEGAPEHAVDALPDSSNLSKTDILPCPSTCATCTYLPKMLTAARLAPNCLTLDVAAMSVDGAPFGPKMSLPRIWKEIALLAKGSEAAKTVALAFSFDVADNAAMPITLALETNDLLSLDCNGQKIPIPDEQSAFFVDRSIRCVSLKGISHQGDNRIVCIYQLHPHAQQSKDFLFETERNRFCPTLEPEAIYLLGRFGVETTGLVTAAIRSSRVHSLDSEQPLFRLVAQQPLQLGQVTSQNGWFYRGAVRYTCTFGPVDAMHSAFLKLFGLHAVTATVSCNGMPPVAVFHDRDPISLPGMYADRDNQIEIVLYGSNRNLLGPLHHCGGEPDFIGSESFSGVYNWTDGFAPELPCNITWTDDYSFVPFGLDNLELIVMPRNSQFVPKAESRLKIFC